MKKGDTIQIQEDINPMMLAGGVWLIILADDKGFHVRNKETGVMNWIKKEEATKASVLDRIDG